MKRCRGFTCCIVFVGCSFFFASYQDARFRFRRTRDISTRDRRETRSHSHQPTKQTLGSGMTFSFLLFDVSWLRSCAERAERWLCVVHFFLLSTKCQTCGDCGLYIVHCTVNFRASSSRNIERRNEAAVKFKVQGGRFSSDFSVDFKVVPSCFWVLVSFWSKQVSFPVIIDWFISIIDHSRFSEALSLFCFFVNAVLGIQNMFTSNERTSYSLSSVSICYLNYLSFLFLVWHHFLTNLNLRWHCELAVGIQSSFHLFSLILKVHLSGMGYLGVGSKFQTVLFGLGMHHMPLAHASSSSECAGEDKSGSERGTLASSLSAKGS